MRNTWHSQDIEQWPLEKLIPYARNSRTHTDAQIAQIAASIAQFGFLNPILVGSDNVVVAGHGRLLAARKLELATVPVVVLPHLTETQKRALIIADNKIAENAGWAFELLAIELDDLRNDGFDLDVLGFNEKELGSVFGAGDAPGGDKDVVDEARNTLLIECASERELEVLFEELKGRGFECKVMA